jgi:hypothetical protein
VPTKKKPEIKKKDKINREPSLEKLALKKMYYKERATCFKFRIFDGFITEHV